jgi:hypothetical protein
MIFRDFEYFAIESIHSIRYVGGFARAASVNPYDYLQAQADPLLAFAAPIIKHMNDDHSDSIVAMVQYYIGVPCKAATIQSLDKLGMTVSLILAIHASSPC